jgi:RimJ/RimL family protein N-acetyltransferase
MRFTTERLQIRAWHDADRAPFAAMNADARVRQFFPDLQTREQSDASIDRWRAECDAQGWSFQPVALRASGEFIGFVGLTVTRHAVRFAPCVEIGWRLAAAHWHQGYASEAARAWLRLGFEQLGLDRIVSLTSVLNRPSIAVMERIGMVNAQTDFDHPALPEGHRLRRHCLYVLTRAQWLTQRAQ